MGHYLIPLLLTLFLAGQPLVASAACVIGEQGCEEMACCEQAESGASPSIAKICCETVCGKPVSNDQTEPQPPAQLPSLFLAFHHPIIPIQQQSEAAALVVLKSAQHRLLKRRPPPLFLSHSSFLI